MRREGLVHTGVELQSGSERHRIAFDELVGRTIVVYGQTEVVKDLIAARLESGRPLLFEVSDVSLHDLESEHPRVRYVHDGAEQELECDFVAGCDGFHGVSRPSIPAGVLRDLRARLSLRLARHHRGRRAVPRRAGLRAHRAWVRAPQHALAGALTPLPPVRARRGSRRSGPTSGSGRSCRRGSAWTAGRCTRGRSSRRASRRCEASSSSRCSGGACSSRATRRTSCRRPARRASTSRSATWRRSRRRSSPGTATATSALLDAYSETCLRRAWRAEHFSWWMTTMLHRAPGYDEFTLRLQQSQLRYLRTSPRRPRRRSRRTTSGSSTPDGLTCH